MDKKVGVEWGGASGFGTRVVWGGEQVQHPYNATQTPIVVSAAYGYQDIDAWYDVALGKQPGYIYSRMSNPTVATLEAKLCELEQAESAVAFSSGMAAISGVLHTFLANGKRVILSRDSYGGTNKISEEFLPRMGVQVCLCDSLDTETIEYEISRDCDLLYLETPTNPPLKVLDIRRLVAAAKCVGALVVADNTFATPLNQNHLTLGGSGGVDEHCSESDCVPTPLRGQWRSSRGSEVPRALLSLGAVGGSAKLCLGVHRYCL